MIIISRFDGIIRKLYYEVDDIVKVGLFLVDIEIVVYVEVSKFIFCIYFFYYFVRNLVLKLKGEIW